MTYRHPILDRMTRLKTALVMLATLSVLLVLAPHAAQADTTYTDEACQGSSLTWNPFTGGSSGLSTQSSCPEFQVGAGVASWGAGTAMWSFYAPGGTTLSSLNVGNVSFSSTDGYGSGLVGDTGGGLSADNDPRILNEGKSIPDTTGGDTANCWGYGGSGNGLGSANYTQIKTADHADIGCSVTGASAGYNLSGHNYVGIGVAAEQRGCVDTTDGGNCGGGAASASLTSAVATVDDPYNNPSLSGLSVSGLPGGTFNNSGWLSYDYDSGTVSASASASDPGGVCNLQVTISGPSGTVASGGNAMGTQPSGYDAGTGSFTAPSGGTPGGCPTSQSAGTNGINLNGLAAGTYTVTAQAQNPGNVVGDNGPSSTSSSFNVDNTVPSVSVSDNNAGGGTWTSTGTQSYAVNASAGPAGVYQINCSGNGLGTPDSNGNATSGSTTISGGGGNVTVRGNGTDSISCSAETNSGVPTAANVTPATGQTIKIDTVAPSIAVAPTNTGLLNSWTNQSQAVTIDAQSGVSGISSGNAACTINRDGAGATAVTNGGTGTGWASSDTTSSDAGEWDLNFTQTGRYAVSCVTTNGAGVSSSPLNTTVEVDMTTPAALASANDVAATGTASGFVETDANAQSASIGDPTTNGSTVSNAAAAWTGDATSVTLDPTNASASASADPRSPIVASTCAQNAVQGVTGVGDGGTIPGSTQSATGTASVSNTLHTNGQIDLNCTVTNAAGTTSDAFDYFLNVDQQSPSVAYANAATGNVTPAAALSGSDATTPTRPLTATAEGTMLDGNASPSVEQAYTAKVVAGQQAAIAAGAPARAFARPSIAGGNGLIAMDGAQAAPNLPNGVNNRNVTLAFYNAATSTSATPAEPRTLSGISGGKCSDYNATTGGAPALYTSGASQNVMPSGAAATLAVPAPALNAATQTAGIQQVDCSSATNGALPQVNPIVGWADNAQATPSTDELDIDNAVPATVSFAGDTSSDATTWYPNEATINVTANPINNEPINDLSDIATVTCAVDDPTFGQADDPNTSDYQSFPVSSGSTSPYTAAVQVDQNDTSTLQGHHVVSCFATNGAGLNGTVDSAQTFVQNGTTTTPGTPGGPPSTDPDCLTFCAVATGPFAGTTTYGSEPSATQWMNKPYTTTVTATQASDSPPISDIVCAAPPLDTTGGNANQPEAGTVDFPNPNPGQTETLKITADSPGGWVMCYATYDDPSTGNQVPLGSMGAFKALVDTDNPLGYFQKRDSNNPETLKFYAHDATSGVGKVVIQLVPQTGTNGGQTVTLPLTSNTVGNGLYVAQIPSTIAKGTWQAQAIVTDLAGNSATINSVGSDGGPALPIISTPVGVGTSIKLAAAAGPKYPPLPGGKVCTTTAKAVTKRVHGKVEAVYVTKRVKGHNVRVKKTRKVKTCATTATAKTLVLKHGQRAALHGQVTTAQGQVAGGQTITVVQTVSGKSKTLKSLTTNANGEFKYMLAAGPSRTITINYNGSGPLASTTSLPLTTKVKGAVSLKASVKTIAVGHTLKITGRVAGGFLPVTGALVKLQYLIVGPKDKWGNVDTYRANAKSGKFTIKLPIKAGSGGHVYEFRVTVPTQSGWAWTAATSKTIKVTFVR